MQDLWRLSAADLASLIRSKKVSAKEAATAALARLDAVNPEDQRRRRPQAGRGAGAGVRHRRRDRARRGRRAARGCAGYGEGQYRPGRLCHHQRPQAAARCYREDQQPGDRQSAQGRRRHSRPHQLPGIFLSLVHHQSGAWRHQKPARSRHHAGRLVRRRGRCGRGRHRPHRARHRYRGLDPLSRLCLWRAWPAADVRPHRGVQCGVAGAPDRPPDLGGVRPAGAHHRRSDGSRWLRCRARTFAIPGGCRRRWKARRCRSASRCASIPMDSIPCRK